MEKKKSKQYLQENIKMNQAQKELEAQIEELNQTLEDRDIEIEELEKQCKELQDEVNRKRVMNKQKKLSKASTMMGNNPLIQA